MSTPEPVPLSVGLLIKERYVLERLVGSGGMGRVYEGRDRVLDKRVALKILHPSISGDEDLRARFLREARAASALDHPHVVKSLDFGVHAGVPFMVMEFLEGETLAALLSREGVLAPARALSLLEPVARAVERAHRTGIIHRDLKPENVFLAERDGDGVCVPTLLDFGIAKRVHGDDLALTKGAVSLGTPYYMAPEQITDAKTVSAAADQYAFAVMLYQAVTAHFPHEVTSYNELVVKKVTCEPRPIADIRADIPEAFGGALMRALSRDPAARYPSIEDFRQALVGAIGQPLPPPTNWRQAHRSSPSPAGDDALLDTLHRPSRGHESATPDEQWIFTDPAAGTRWSESSSKGTSRTATPFSASDAGVPRDAALAGESDRSQSSGPSARPRRAMLATLGAAALGLLAFGAVRLSGSDSAATRANLPTEETPAGEQLRERALLEVKTGPPVDVSQPTAIDVVAEKTAREPPVPEASPAPVAPPAAADVPRVVSPSKRHAPLAERSVPPVGARPDAGSAETSPNPLLELNPYLAH